MRVLICLMAFAFLLGGCGPPDKIIRDCQNFCRDFEGVSYITHLGFSQYECVCQDGKSFILNRHTYIPEPKLEEERPETSSF